MQKISRKGGGWREGGLNENYNKLEVLFLELFRFLKPRRQTRDVINVTLT